MSRLAKNLDPAYSVPGLDKPLQVSGLLNVPKPTIATISNYLSMSENELPIEGKNQLLNKMKKVTIPV